VATKKGIILTAIILGIITVASFSLWLVPQHSNSGPLISDYNSELESIKERHGIIINETSGELNNMLNGSISPDDFITGAQTSSSQVDSLLSEIIESKAPQEWRESYLNYGEALKKYRIRFLKIKKIPVLGLSFLQLTSCGKVIEHFSVTLPTFQNF